MTDQWNEVPVEAPYMVGYASAGLLIVHSYDMDRGGCMADWFEIRHRATGEFMLEVVDVELERAQEIAADLAALADWAALSTTDEVMLQAKLMAFGLGYPGEVVASHDWGSLSDLDRIVPYGRH